MSCNLFLHFLFIVLEDLFVEKNKSEKNLYNFSGN